MRALWHAPAWHAVLFCRVRSDTVPLQCGSWLSPPAQGRSAPHSLHVSPATAAFSVLRCPAAAVGPKSAVKEV